MYERHCVLEEELEVRVKFNCSTPLPIAKQYNAIQQCHGHCRLQGAVTVHSTSSLDLYVGTIISTDTFPSAQVAQYDTIAQSQKPKKTRQDEPLNLIEPPSKNKQPPWERAKQRRSLTETSAQTPIGAIPRRNNGTPISY